MRAWLLAPVWCWLCKGLVCRVFRNSSPFWEDKAFEQLDTGSINCRREKCELERCLNVADSNPGISS